jgi:hypothetical protein
LKRRLILRAGVEAGDQIVQLNRAKREKWRDVQVDTGAQGEWLLFSLLVFEEFNLAKALLRFLFGLVGTPETFSLFGKNFVSAGDLLDHDELPRSLSRAATLMVGLGGRSSPYRIQPNVC